jgi:hypothetical protein
MRRGRVHLAGLVLILPLARDTVPQDVAEFLVLSPRGAAWNLHSRLENLRAGTGSWIDGVVLIGKEAACSGG